MDAAVLAAMAKWPNVPAVYGWLGLTARGDWRIKGQPIVNEAIRDFIGRNYACDERGRWYFQNGPQRVYVALEVTPWIYRLHPIGLVAHTGARPRELRAAALLDDGRFALGTELGCGLLDDRDTGSLAAALGPSIERLIEDDEAVTLQPRALALGGGACRIERLGADDLPARFGFVRVPAP